MTNTVVFPMDFEAYRKALVDELQRCAQATVIMAEPEVTKAPRPAKPYFTMKFINPSIKRGDDGVYPHSGGSTLVTHGGQREMVISFQCFGCSHEQAYNYMCLWQGWLELETAQARLRTAGIAVWKSDGVRDISMLLETAYEGRSQLDVHFGVASNLTEDTGGIETVNIGGVAYNADSTVASDLSTIIES